MSLVKEINEEEGVVNADGGKSCVLRLENVRRRYRSGSKELEVLKGVSFEIEEGSKVAIIGPSGSGKTTLLGICAGLDLPTSGTVSLGGVNLAELSEDGRAALRNREVGFVFQNFQLLPTLSALENVMIPLELKGKKGARAEAEKLLERVGLGDRLDHYPIQHSSAPANPRLTNRATGDPSPHPRSPKTS